MKNSEKYWETEAEARELIKTLAAEYYHDKNLKA